MWCQHCQQDMPAVGVATGGALRCSRCLRESLPPVDMLSTARNERPPIDALAELLEGPGGARLRELGRRLESPTIAIGDQSLGSFGQDALATFRRDPTHWSAASPAPSPAGKAIVQPIRQPKPWTQLVAWVASGLGGALLLVGGGIIAHSLATTHASWWSWGLGCLLVGQSLLVIGLLRVLVSLWFAARDSQQRLTSAQQQLGELRRTADALVGERHPTAASFFANLSREANPHMLLASLRGQLDELVSRMHADV